MEVSTLTAIASVGLVLTLLNELIVWKMWPKCVHQNSNVRQRTVVSTLFIDPLVAAIACPMATDLYFMIQWTHTCDLFFVFTMSVTLLVMYGCSLVMACRIVAIMSPHPTNSTVLKDDHWLTAWRDSPALSFVVCVLANVVLAWVTVALTYGPYTDYSYYEPETCWPSILRKSSLLTCGLCFTLQAVNTLFYARLSAAMSRKFKHVLYERVSNSPDSDNYVTTASQEDVQSVVIYTLTAMFCLAMSNVLRLSYTICSCHSYMALASSLHFVNWLVVAKLPCAGILYWALSRCQQRVDCTAVM